MDQDITTTPTVLAGTEVDRWYTMQNLGDIPVRFKVSATQPNATDRSFFLAHSATANVKHPSGSSVWVWTPRGRSALFYDKGE